MTEPSPLVEQSCSVITKQFRTVQIVAQRNAKCSLLLLVRNWDRSAAVLKVFALKVIELDNEN